VSGIPRDAPWHPDRLGTDMSNWRSPTVGSWQRRAWRSPEARQWLRIAWRLFQLLTVLALAGAGWRLLGHTPYRIDVDVYRMGGRAWLDGTPLYSHGVSFHTRPGLDLPFTYPPLAAIAFSPFAWLPLPLASAAITVTTLALLLLSTMILLTGLNVWADSAITSEPAWLRRMWLAGAIVAPAVVYFEPIRSNFAFGQINVVLMTLVIADCVPRRTPWPRGLLLGLAIALKLTPAVFLVYFMLRRDGRAMAVSAASFAGATLTGFVLAWRDSWEYWTTTISDTGRIGTAALNTNQNIAGALARLGLGDGARFVLWTLACCAVLMVTLWAARRVLGAAGPATSGLGAAGPATSGLGAAGPATSEPSEPVLALICVAMLGLMVSPVSWSHHWVWALPAVLVTAVLAYQLRNAALAVVSIAGIALMVWVPFTLLPEHREQDASWWRQLAGMSYVWWALAVIVVAGGTAVSRARARRQAALGSAPVPAVS
jgi:alpha-1,2-mannosyltransferase